LNDEDSGSQKQDGPRDRANVVIVQRARAGNLNSILAPLPPMINL